MVASLRQEKLRRRVFWISGRTQRARRPGRLSLDGLVRNRAMAQPLDGRVSQKEHAFGDRV